ncbi:MAG: hypothetical protein BGN85_09430 [Alphaproteobacteria bacterium 64-11]|jgi:hypothetical protein|nr:MAG: hypothetical protein BGN85_09430 [Alphaproteobacteria bacterium 64-11]
MNDAWLDIATTADRADVDVSTVRKWVRENRYPSLAHKVGGRWRIDPTELDRILSGQRGAEGLKRSAADQEWLDELINHCRQDALCSARVTAGFRSDLFDAATRAGMTAQEFVITAAAEKLRGAGRSFPGPFPGETQHAA